MGFFRWSRPSWTLKFGSDTTTAIQTGTIADQKPAISLCNKRELPAEAFILSSTTNFDNATVIPCEQAFPLSQLRKANRNRFRLAF